ncbi:HotDog domain-containing protein [Cokeromyces recurvatus]|uniref:HotDog domain-containing protein n=1 Tax=Cokeromyces recurvatus TaxID=90255 RepID=UPI0022204D61|nr:HotDog domain-containing protein [Cokeromyces recurvatus]KAI7901431.1 HotDog domain-containing protein [Cokeromyces recurvatus]
MKLDEKIAKRYPKLEEAVNYYGGKHDKQHLFWEDNVGNELSIVAAEPNKLTWEFAVKENHCNQLGNLHGGCVATLIDICSSYAILVATSHKPWNLIGISTDLSVAYLRGISEGEIIRIVCEVQRVGSTLSNIFTRIYDQENRLCYSGSHTKFNIDSRL